MTNDEYRHSLEEVDAELRRVLADVSRVWVRVKGRITEVQEPPPETGPVFDGGIPTRTGMGDFDYDI